MSFEEWLTAEKKFTSKSAKDVQSRLKRANEMVGVSNDTVTTVDSLTNNEQFSQLSMCVKSQLKRAVKLYREYIENE